MKWKYQVNPLLLAGAGCACAGGGNGEDDGITVVCNDGAADGGALDQTVEKENGFPICGFGEAQHLVSHLENSMDRPQGGKDLGMTKRLTQCQTLLES